MFDTETVKDGDVADLFTRRPADEAETMFAELKDDQIADSSDSGAVVGRGNASKVMRELVQNADDARAVPDAPVRFRVREVTLAPEDVDLLTGPSGAAHWRACGIDVDRIRRGGTRALVFEDFGTTGLTGAGGDDASGGSAFASYFLSFGESGKKAGAGGSHGVGGRASLVDLGEMRMFVGHTERVDGTARMMGQAHLRSHVIRGRRYYKYGIHAGGFRRDDDGVRRYQPVRGNAARERAARLGCTRRAGEPGLSVVVPAVHADVGVGGDDPESGLKAAALANFFHHVAVGRMVFEFDDETIDATNVEAALARNTKLAHRVPLARLSRADVAGELRVFGVDVDGDGLSAASFSDGQREAMRAAWERGEAFAVEARMPFARRGGTIRRGSVRALVRPAAADERASCVFVREGCMLSRERPKGGGRTMAVVAVESGAASEFFGHVERASHDRWYSDDVRRNGVHRTRDAGRVADVRALPGVVEGICAPDEDARPIATRFDAAFCVPADALDDTAWRMVSVPDADRGEDLRDGPMTEPEPDSPDVPEAGPDEGTVLDAAVCAEAVPGGMRVTGRVAAEGLRGARIAVSFAYPAPRGDSFLRHRIMDFDFEGRNPDVQPEVECRSVRVVRRVRNTIVIEVDDPGFELRVTGFDDRLALECRCEMIA